MANLNYTKNRSYAIEHTFRKHLKPKIGDIVLAFDYDHGCDTMIIGKLLGIVSVDNPRCPFKVESLEWKNCDTFHWQQAYKIPKGLVSVETND